jgi:hypothetical protein
MGVLIAMMLASEPINCNYGRTDNHFDRNENCEGNSEEALKQASLNAARVAMNYAMFDRDKVRDERWIARLRA